MLSVWTCVGEEDADVGENNNNTTNKVRRKKKKRGFMFTNMFSVFLLGEMRIRSREGGRRWLGRGRGEERGER